MHSRRRALAGLSAAAIATLCAAGAPAHTLEAPASQNSPQAQAPLPEQKSVHPATLKAVPRPAHAAEGEVFTIEIIVHGGRNVGAAAFHVVYDPSRMTPVPSEFREGAWMKQGGATTEFLATSASTD